MSHTPLPWPKLPGYHQFTKDDEAFILKVVNSHNVLLKILRRVLAILDGGDKKMSVGEAAFDLEVIKAVKRAIAKAGGKA